MIPYSIDIAPQIKRIWLPFQIEMSEGFADLFDPDRNASRNAYGLWSKEKRQHFQ